MVKCIRTNGGLATKKDFENYKAIYRKVLKDKYKEYDIYTTSLPTSGVFLIQALKILEKFNLDDLKELGEKVNSYPHYHLLVEIFKFIAARRGELTDPAFLENPDEIIKEIISDKTINEIISKIDFNGVLSDKDYNYKVPAVDDHGTTHLCVIDENEMVVQITSTINLEFGAKFMDHKTGIILNDEIDDFYVPGIKNAFDLEQMPANIIEPEKRPFSSAAPVLLVKENEVVALGAAGGTRIPTSIIAVIFHLILGKSLKDAIMASRIHHQLKPNFTYVESNFQNEIKNYLESRGQKVVLSLQNSIFTSVQGIHMIITNDGDKIIQAYSDARKGGESDGY